MPIRNYNWRIPYRPKGFFKDTPLHFSLSLEIDKVLYDMWVERNEEIGNEKKFEGFYWGDNMHLWVVDSVEEEDLFSDLTDELYDLFFDRVEDDELITQADCVNYLLSFVHQFRYSFDKKSIGISEYARFPIETLYDKTGDCECLAILLSALIYATDVAQVGIIRVRKNHFFSPESRHVAVGVVNSEDDSMFGTYIEHDGEKYYYCEATGTYSRVGNLPQEYRNGKFYVYPIY